MKPLMPEGAKSMRFPCVRIRQPIGEFYVGLIENQDLREITHFDIRRILHEREFETYLGIQRPISKKRIVELENYIVTMDACFPTAVILSVPGVCAEFDENAKVMTLSNYADESVEEAERIHYGHIAKVIDGQHRIEALKNFEGAPFDINVSVFVDADVAQEAYVFSTVNLAQTKVDKSLVYDLFDLAKARSPQKLCHNIAVALDRNESSPFYKRIKRLGRATPGREKETLTQATFVQALIRYMSKDANTQIRDRDIYKRGSTPGRAVGGEAKKLIFRNMMLDERDVDITNILWNYFEAIASKWQKAWNAEVGTGLMLNRTNGFRAFMRLLRPIYLSLSRSEDVPPVESFAKVIERITLQDEEFNTENFLPGSSGESLLYKRLLNDTGFVSGQ